MVSKEELLVHLEVLKKKIEKNYFGEIHTFCIIWATKNNEFELIVGNLKEAHWLCSNTINKIQSERRNIYKIDIKKGDNYFKM